MRHIRAADVRYALHSTSELAAAWCAVLEQLFAQYEPSDAGYAPQHRKTAIEKARDGRNIGDSFFMACDTGVPLNELAGAFVMIFGETPFTDDYLRR